MSDGERSFEQRVAGAKEARQGEAARKKADQQARSDARDAVDAERREMWTRVADVVGRLKTAGAAYDGHVVAGEHAAAYRARLPKGDPNGLGTFLGNRRLDAFASAHAIGAWSLVDLEYMSEFHGEIRMSKSTAWLDGDGWLHVGFSRSAREIQRVATGAAAVFAPGASLPADHHYGQVLGGLVLLAARFDLY